MCYTLRVYNQITEPLDCEGTYILNTKLQKRTTTLDLAQATVDEQRGGGGVDGNFIHHPLLRWRFYFFSLYEKKNNFDHPPPPRSQKLSFYLIKMLIRTPGQWVNPSMISLCMVAYNSHPKQA